MQDRKGIFWRGDMPRTISLKGYSTEDTALVGEAVGVRVAHQQSTDENLPNASITVYNSSIRIKDSLQPRA